jgi:anti-anti-sigma factor
VPPELEHPLVIEVRREGDEATLTLAGELDPHTAPRLADEIDGLIGSGVTSMVMVLADLGFIDSSGLRVVISADRELTERGGGLVLRSPSETVRRLLDLTGLLGHLTVD